MSTSTVHVSAFKDVSTWLGSNKLGGRWAVNREVDGADIPQVLYTRRIIFPSTQHARPL